MSGQRARTSALPRSTASEEFSEPDFELLELTGDVVAKDAERPSPAEDLDDRDRTIDSLTLRLITLQGEMEDVCSALRARESEVAELQKLLSHAPPPPSLPSLPPARQASSSPVVDRVVVRPRRDPTLPEAALDFRLDLEFHDESQFFVGMSGDVAKGGLFVATYKTLPVGTHVALEMSLTDGTELRVDGVVDWLRDQREAASERPGMGVAFNDLSEDAHAALDRVCGQREPLYFEAE